MKSFCREPVWQSWWSWSWELASCSEEGQWSWPLGQRWRPEGTVQTQPAGHPGFETNLRPERGKKLINVHIHTRHDGQKYWFLWWLWEWFELWCSHNIIMLSKILPSCIEFCLGGTVMNIRCTKCTCNAACTCTNVHVSAAFWHWWLYTNLWVDFRFSEWHGRGRSTSLLQLTLLLLVLVKNLKELLVDVGMLLKSVLHFNTRRYM